MRISTLMGGVALVAATIFGGAANASTLDFVQLANAGEGGVLSNFSLGGFTVTAHGSNADGGGNVPAGFNSSFGSPYAYLDAGGGMGVCQALTQSNQCTPSNDDNVTGSSPGHTEILSLNFNHQAWVSDLTFKADGHNFQFDATDAIDISIDGISWVTYFLMSDNTGKLFGDPLFILAADQFLHFRFNNEQFYLASANVSAVPLPAGGLLLLTGLGGLGILGRRRARSAATA